MKRLRHPVRAVREPFGTAGLVVACVALVLACTGAAFAAGKLTSTQKKEVEKIAKRFAGKPGAPGAQGAQGPAGPAGANGKDGANGNNGVSPTGTAFSGEQHGCKEGGVEFKGANTTFACNGVKGQTGFTATLPPEQTETGTWGFAGYSHAAGEARFTPISFNIPLESAPVEVHFIAFEETVPTGCFGTPEKPGAEEGNLCVFQTAAEFTEPLDGSVRLFTPDLATPEASGTVGAMVAASTTGAGPAFEAGTFAVTAE